MSQNYTWPAAASTIGGTVDTNLKQVGGVAISEGQKTMSASLPVVIASDQSTLPVSGPLTDTQLRATAVPVSGPLTDTQLRATPVPVSLTSTTVTGTVAATQSGTWNVTNVTGTVSLPTGASTSALQTTGNTSLSSIDTKTPALGQAVMASSVPVAIASNQSAIPTSVVDLTATGNITTQNLVPAGTATAGSAVLSGTLNGQASALVQVTGTYTGALSLQGTIDGSTWVTVGGTPFMLLATGAIAATIVSASVGIFEVEVAGFNQFRITGLAAMTGTAVVTIRSTIGNNAVSLMNALPVGANIIGALTANQSVNVAQINGVTPLMGNGVTGTGSQRVTIASDNTAFPVNAVQSGTWTVQPGNTANTTAWLVNEAVASTSTLTNVSSSASSVSVLSSNSGRKGALFFNDSTALLYLKFGTTASTTSFTVQIPSGGYYEMPGPKIYSGAIDGIWASANGTLRVTELS